VIYAATRFRHRVQKYIATSEKRFKKHQNDFFFSNGGAAKKVVYMRMDHSESADRYPGEMLD
jgi:hypothetical protein